MRISDCSSDVCSSDLRPLTTPKRKPALRRLAVRHIHAHRAARVDLGRLRFDQPDDMADHVGVRDMMVGDAREEDHMLAAPAAGDADVGFARFAGAVDDAADRKSTRLNSSTYSASRMPY